MIIINPTKKWNIVYQTESKKTFNKDAAAYIGKFKIINGNIQSPKYGKTRIITDLLNNEEICLTRYDKKLNSFLEENNYEYTTDTFCDKCLKSNKITSKDNKKFYEYHKNNICRKCAKKLIEKNLLKYENNFFTVSEMLQLLDKGYSLKEVVNIFNSDTDYTFNREKTLYDTLEVTEKRTGNMKLSELPIPEILESILSDNVDTLMPIQEKAINNGLFDDENLLIISPTASGKTLIGELAGIPKVLLNKKMVYLTPLVALANQKYHDFRNRYHDLDLNIVIKVGKNRVKDDEELTIPDEDIKDADIIIATYEGLDYILRSGEYYKLNTLGTVVVDEIHMLEDPDRGFRLNALINRLIMLFEDTQIIALSATIKNSDEVAQMFNLKLVEYDKRPIKLERHRVYCQDDEDKLRKIIALSRRENTIVSGKGFPGQTIIFTNSRYKTEYISERLNKESVKSEAYHSGLSFSRKTDIVEKFMNHEISTVVTTAALAVGVDFPASLVIFESLKMGIKNLSVNEFHQMLGRAGRPSYHEVGKVYLLPSLVTTFMNNEISLSLRLLGSEVESINTEFNYQDLLDYSLSNVCTFNEIKGDVLRETIKDVGLYHVGDVINDLTEKNLIVYDDEYDTFKPTGYGRAVCMSFLKVDEAEFIMQNWGMDPLELSIKLESLNVYVSNHLLKQLKHMGLNSNSLNSNAILSVIFGYDGSNFLDKRTKRQLYKLIEDFAADDNETYTLYDNLKNNIAAKIMEYRLINCTPNQISKTLEEKYALKIYPGDIYNWLDRIVYKLESIGRISKATKKITKYNECQNYIEKII